MVNTYINYLIAIATSEIFWHPVSIMKNNYIRHGNINFFNTINNKGIIFYYQTSPLIITKQMMCLSAKYSLYNYFKNYYSVNHYDLLNSMACYGIVSLIEHPFENIFIKVTSSDKKISCRNLFFNMYQGYSATFIRQMTCSILLPINDFYKRIFGDYYLSYILAASTTTLIVHPIDLVRIRLVTKSGDLNFKTIKLYEGLHLSLLRNIGHFTFTMMIYKYLTS